MPLIQIPHQSIEIQVSDIVINDTIIKQKAKFLSLNHTQDFSGECAAKVTVAVSMYASVNGGFGPQLQGQGFSSYIVELVANNQTVVDATTGEILAIRQQEDVQSWSTIANSFAQPVMFQGDFFEYLRENEGVKIGDMIRQHIMQADMMGKFSHNI